MTGRVEELKEKLRTKHSANLSQSTAPAAVGKDVLELLSSSMYDDPLSIYREFVQNSSDAIDEAVASGVLAPEEARIDIRLDGLSRQIEIRDNGSGLNNTDFRTRMTSIGGSAKRGSKARGFRGVGRLAGLGFCQELIFRSRAKRNEAVLEAVWDCRKIKQLLYDVRFRGSLAELVSEVLTIREATSVDYPERFFEVVVCKPLRLSNDPLLNETGVRGYLSQVAPVPFCHDFSFGNEIREWLSNLTTFSTYDIYLNDSEQPIYRPHKNQIGLSDIRHSEVSDVEFVCIEAIDEGVAAVGWILHHDYVGAFPNSSLVKGLRARIGNIQIGGMDPFVEIFPESRFNSWTVGELHILDRRLIPNGRRDDFEPNVHLSNLKTQLVPIGHHIARRCRVSSTVRNRIRAFELSEQKIHDHQKIIEQGTLSLNLLEPLKREVGAELQQMEHAASFDLISDEVRSGLFERLSELKKNTLASARNGQGKDPLGGLPEHEREIYRRVFDLLFECAPNKVVAQSLIDKMTARLSALE